MTNHDNNAEHSGAPALVRGDGVDLACYADGPTDAPVLVFVHGYPDNHGVWDRIVAKLATDYRCIRYDVRGAGRSSRPSSTSAYTLDHLAADLAAVIDWASPAAPVHLIGHDWGSIQSWEAATDPALSDRIDSFTSISGPCLDHVGYWLRQQWHTDRAGLLKQLRKSWYVFAFHLPGLPSLLWYAGLGRRWPSIVARMEGMTLPENPSQARDGATGIALYRANIVARLRAPRKRRAQMPVQVIVPERDPFVGPGFVAGLDRWVKTLTVKKIDAAHWAIQSEAETIATHCRHFVDAIHAETAPQRTRNPSSPEPAQTSA